VRKVTEQPLRVEALVRCGYVACEAARRALLDQFRLTPGVQQKKAAERNTSMSVTVLDERHSDSAEAVVTITVQIKLAGTELPPAATRLITELEALAGEVPAADPRERDRAPRLVTSPAQPAPKVRRIGKASDQSPSLCLHTGSRLLLRDGGPVDLTRREFDLFQFLCENPRRVFTRAQLLRLVWGYDMVGTERTVDVHIRRLRVKLGDCSSSIATVRGVGYRLDDDAPVDIVVQED
jgi:two-component system, OmpR family, response regulator